MRLRYAGCGYTVASLAAGTRHTQAYNREREARLRNARKGCQRERVAFLGDDALQVPRGHRRLVHTRHDALKLRPKRVAEAAAALCAASGTPCCGRACCGGPELTGVQRAVHGGVYGGGLLVHGGGHDFSQHVEVEEDLQRRRDVGLAERGEAGAQELVARGDHLLSRGMYEL